MPYSAPGPFLGAQTAAAYKVSRSLRFRSSASAYLSRTPASAGNRKTWTWSAWIKRGTLGTSQYLLTIGSSYTDTGFMGISFAVDSATNSDCLNLTTGTQVIRRSTNQLRDPSAWYHCLIAFDTTQSTASNRAKMYVNGTQVTVFQISNDPALNTDYGINQALTTYLGRNSVTADTYFDGYIAEQYFIDGSALTPSSFGQSNALTGVWEPKQYTGTYGTNGFYLPYSDPSGSGNGNDTYTKLLLHGNGLNDSAWNGSSNHALTAFGSATTSTTQTKFGMSSSLYTLGSSSQYFRTDASADFKYAAASGSTNDFTFDFWFYPGASGTQAPVIGIADTTYSSFLMFATQFYASSNNTSWDIGNGQTLGSPTLNQWNHYAVVRSGSTWYTFLNGVQQATWTNSSAGYDYTTNNFIQIGRAQGGSLYSTGYYAELRWSAGIARWTSAFTPPTTPYSGGAGSDSSGNVNAWRPFNINTATSGTTYDSMIDSPTNYADGGNGRGNYCTWNPVDNQATSPTFSNANLTLASVSYLQAAVGTIEVSSGKYYWEIIPETSVLGVPQIGVAKKPYGSFGGNGISNSPNAYVYQSNATKGNNGTYTAYGASYAVGDVIGVALDMDAGTLVFYKNNTSQGTAFTGLTGSFAPIFGGSGASNLVGCSANFGQRPFTYTPPSGFSALNTQNLPTPTIANGAQYMGIATYPGNAGSNSYSSLSFQPDFLWSKSRTSTAYHYLIDSVRGTSKALYSNATDAEGTITTTVTFNTNGVAYNGSESGLNANTQSYVNWLWNAGGAPTTDNVAGAGNVPTAGSVKINGANSSATLAGSIAATRLSANTSAGFSVVTWTAGSGTVAHGLGVVPQIIIEKKRDATGDWLFGHSLVDGSWDYLRLNTTDANSNSAVSGPSSSVFTPNTGSSTVVAYCFAPIAGYSAFGSYTGNGSTDGPFVYTGFRPRWLLIKQTSAAGLSWWILDTTRNTYNVVGNYLFADLTNAETDYNATYPFDFLSNGFKLRVATTATNASGATYIYAAFAENPFKYSRAR